MIYDYDGIIPLFLPFSFPQCGVPACATVLYLDIVCIGKVVHAGKLCCQSAPYYNCTTHARFGLSRFGCDDDDDHSSVCHLWLRVSCLILSGLVLSGLVLSCLVLSCR